MSSQQHSHPPSQAAFLNATSALPNFSLPPNLNTKTTQNKQKQENERPALTSGGLSQSTLEDIQLPAADHLQSALLTNEMTWLLVMATVGCLLSSCYLALTSERSFMATASIGKWSLVLFALLFNLHQLSAYYPYSIYLSASALCLWAMITYGKTCSSVVCVFQFGAVVLFLIVYRLSIIYQRLQTHLSQQQHLYHSQVQQAIGQAVEQHTAQHQSFLAVVSQEMKDTASTVMATLEQFAPLSILSNTHELLSACSIAVPTTSISAIHTMIKQTCHISSHFNLLVSLLHLNGQTHAHSSVSQEFDMAELIQSVGDALAGMSAKLGVHLVIYHMDDALYYPNVVGDEDATRHALLSLLKNMLEGCTPGACIEIGLLVTSIPDSQKLKATLHITHTASPSIPPGLSAAPIPNTDLTVRLIQFIRGQMDMKDLDKNKTQVKLTFELPAGSNHEQRLLLIERQLSNVQFSNEPTLGELNSFMAKLKGVRLILHAPEKSIFAKHLTSCLAGWNTDISHLPVLGYNTVDEESSVASDSTHDTDTSSHSQQPIKTPLDIHALLSPSNRPINALSNNNGSSTGGGNKVPSPAIAEEQIHSIPPAFILIDDDIMTFEKKLKEFRDKPCPSQPQVPTTTSPQVPSSQTQQQLSNLAAPQTAPPPPRRHRRTKSRSSLVSDVMMNGTVAVVFFSSLSNYKRVRDTIQWFSHVNVPGLPRVVVVPKPAGPRRFLTALHTAWRNAVVEPQFIPIATSPVSPYISANMISQHAPSESAVTGLTPNAALTPHDPTRFSPGGRRPRLHSPNGLHMESEKGNYFFDPLAAARPNIASSTSGMLPPKLNTSPHLMTVKSSGLMTAPIISTTTATTTTTTTPTTPNTNPSQIDLKRPFRSHSNSFVPTTPSRRNLVDLARSPSLSNGKQASPLPEDDKHLTEMATEVLPPPVVAANHASFHGNLEHIVSPKMDPQDNTNTTTNVAVNTPGASDTSNENTTAKPKSKYNFKLSNRKRKEKSAQPEKQSPPITVLIVEDNMINQAILSTWMRKHKIKFSVASDGKEAVEKWKGGGFHLILMDIQLPVLDGLEATKMIRSIEKERRIGVLPTTIDEVDEEAEEQTVINQEPESTKTSLIKPTENRVFQSPVIIVALTASSLETDRQAALAAGCNDFLTKPVSLEWLEKKIMEWGCMQALIDFEGWRKWKDKQNAPTNPFLKQQPQKRDPQEKEEQQRVRDQLGARVKEMLKDDSRAIVLLGLNRKDRAVQSKKTRNNYGSRRSVSDSLLELSIPKQLEARERKRQLEQEALLSLSQSSSLQDEDEDDESREI